MCQAQYVGCSDCSTRINTATDLLADTAVINQWVDTLQVFHYNISTNILLSFHQTGDFCSPAVTPEDEAQCKSLVGVLLSPALTLVAEQSRDWVLPFCEITVGCQAT